MKPDSPLDVARDQTIEGQDVAVVVRVERAPEALGKGDGSELCAANRGWCAFTAAFQDDRLLLALSRYGKSKVGGVAFERTRPFLDAGIYLMGDEAELAQRLDAMLQDARIGHRMVQRLGLAAG